MKQLAWVHHHHSVLELIDLTFSIKSTSRGVLQEHARHRLQALTVQSTRYTGGSILNAYVATSSQWGHVSEATAKGKFASILNELDIFIFKDPAMIVLESNAIYDKLAYDINSGNVTYADMLSKSALVTFELSNSTTANLFEKLESCKSKRNALDKFKYIVTDNFKVDLICKFNLRSLKNYFDLRDSGAAWFQIQWLAQAMKEVTPVKYLDLIVKNKTQSANCISS